MSVLLTLKIIDYLMTGGTTATHATEMTVNCQCALRLTIYAMHEANTALLDVLVDNSHSKKKWY